jgi:mono/diheme cytochrome c family protein
MIVEVSAAHAGDALAGRATFASICSTCHGANGVATIEYAPSFSRCERLNQSDETLLVSVRDGIGGRMPPWGGFLTEREILDASPMRGPSAVQVADETSRDAAGSFPITDL